MPTHARVSHALVRIPQANERMWIAKEKAGDESLDFVSPPPPPPPPPQPQQRDQHVARRPSLLQTVFGNGVRASWSAGSRVESVEENDEVPRDTKSTAASSAEEATEQTELGGEPRWRRWTARVRYSSSSISFGDKRPLHEGEGSDESASSVGGEGKSDTGGLAETERYANRVSTSRRLHTILGGRSPGSLKDPSPVDTPT